jgi:mono/diheme cytochrome c family protein
VGHKGNTALGLGLSALAAGCVSVSEQTRELPPAQLDPLWKLVEEDPERPQGPIHSSTPNANPGDGPQDIWLTSCSMCHGRDGSAQTWAGRRYMVRDLTATRWRANADLERVIASIRDGVPRSKMRAFGKRMSEQQLVALSNWVLLLAADQPTGAGKPLDDPHPDEAPALPDPPPPPQLPPAQPDGGAGRARDATNPS